MAPSDKKAYVLCRAAARGAEMTDTTIRIALLQPNKGKGPKF